MTDKRALFMLSQGPGHCDLSRHAALARSAGGAGAIIWGDGAYLLTEDHMAPLRDAGVTLYALRESVEARGLTDRVGKDVQLVDYHRVVDLVMDEHDVVL